MQWLHDFGSVERLSPSRGKPNGVAPPVGLPIVDRRHSPPKPLPLVVAARSARPRSVGDARLIPTGLWWDRAATATRFGCWTPVLFQRGGRSPRIGKAEAKPGLSRCPTRSGGSLRWSLLDR